MKLNDKRKMSTEDLIASIRELFKYGTKDDREEILEMIDELYYRYINELYYSDVLKPNIKGKGRA